MDGGIIEELSSFGMTREVNWMLKGHVDSPATSTQS